MCALCLCNDCLGGAFSSRRVVLIKLVESALGREFMFLERCIELHSEYDKKYREFSKITYLLSVFQRGTYLLCQQFYD